MAGLTPDMESDTGVTTLPSIIQDSTETFLHNIAYAINVQLVDRDKPKKILIIGSKNKKDFDFPFTTDPYYSHDIVKQVDLDKDFRPDGLPVRYEYTYGDVTVYYLTESDLVDSDGIVNSPNIGNSHSLSFLNNGGDG